MHDRFDGEGGHPKLIAHLESTPARNVDARAHRALLARLSRGGVPSTSTLLASQASHPFVVSGEQAALLAGVQPSDRQLYEDAIRQLFADDSAGAWQTIAPLVQRYPECYAIQHLGCGLLMQLGYQADVQAVCSRAQQAAAKAPP